MADVILSAELQARVDSFVANLLSAANSATNTATATTQMSTTISRNIANVNRTNLTQFTAALNAGTLSIQRFNNTPIVPLNPRPIVVGANQAAMALTNLGRVAQDAPFGFIGIQNNINPLLESFQRLKTETGSNGAAFRALVGSLAGPAGLGIAVSLITAGLTIYTQYQQKANKATKDAKKEVDNYVDSLTGANRAQLEGAKSAQKDLTNLNLLFNASRNLTLTIEARKSAYKELQNLYPDYFKNISFEQIQGDKTRLAYEKLAVSIIATGRARAAANLIAKDSEMTLQNEQKIADATYSRNRNDLAQKKELAAFDRRTAKLGLSGSEARVSERQAINNKYLIANSELEQFIGKRIDENNIRTARSAKLVELVNTNLQKGAELTGGGIGKGPQGKDIKTLSDVIDELTIELKQNDLAFSDTFNEKRIADIDSYQKAINGLIKIGFAPASAAVQDLIGKQNILAKSIRGIDLSPLTTDTAALLGIKNTELTIKPRLKIEPIVVGFSELQKEADAFNEKFSSTIEKGFGSTLSTIGDSIGAALQNGGDVVNAIGTSILSGFGNFLSQFGDLLIEYGAAAILKGKLDLAIAVPGAGIAAGFAAVAAGIALKIAAGAIGSFVGGKGGKGNGVTAFANGGIISGPTLGLMGEYAGAKSDPEVVAPLSKLKNLLGETDDNGNIINKSNNEPIILIPESVIRGQDIVTSYRKASGTRNRQG